MMRRDRSVQNDVFASAEQYYSQIRKGLREKADHNKAEAQIIFCSIIAFTLAAPLFITLGEGWFWAKALPATLSVLASAATAWLQLRKPQRLWAIYRRAQRELEREKAGFDFCFGEFEDSDDPNRMLAQKVSEIVFRVHEQWEGLVPESDAVVAKTPVLLKSKANENAS